MQDEPSTSSNMVAGCTNRRGGIDYVAQLPGEGGVDWGWTDSFSKARDLSPHWQRRFRAFCNSVGRTARFYTPMHNPEVK